MKEGTKCHCGNKMPAKSSILCNLTCLEAKGGKTKVECGGKNSLTIYRVTPIVKKDKKVQKGKLCMFPSD